jgi:carbamoyltransferase
MYVLGVNGNLGGASHDPAAALIRDGLVVAAVEEERFVRAKHAPGRMPTESARYCLRHAGIRVSDLEWVAFAAATYAGMERKLGDYFKLQFGYVPPLRFVEHHIAHAASAHYLSTFPTSLIVSMDLSGDSVATLVAVGRGATIEPVERVPKPNSLGLFYAMMTQYLGFHEPGDEYKVMALAAQGRPDVDLSDVLAVSNGGYLLNPDYVSPRFSAGKPSPTRQEAYYSQQLVERLGPQRLPSEPILPRHRAIAAGAQARLEEAVIEILRAHVRKTGLRDIVLTGGVALNCRMSGRIRRLPLVRRLFVSPVSSDAGTSLGAALHSYASAVDGFSGAVLSDGYFLGPEYDHREIVDLLRGLGLPFGELDDPASEIATRLACGEIVAVFSGRMEYGPRALGNRSILARPDDRSIADRINRSVKGREPFRPLAPTVLEETFSELFAATGRWPYMTVAVPVRPSWRERLAGVLHTDGTSRVQTVAERDNPLLHAVVRRFFEQTGIPAVLNTSFNTRGRPIVLSPLDAIETFAASPIDALVIEGVLLTRDGLNGRVSAAHRCKIETEVPS